jgi:cell division septation protein DedD
MRSDQSGKFEISTAGVLVLAAATVIASAVVFLLGIYVGKGMVEQRLQQDSHVVRLPVPTPGASAKSDEVDVTFWDKLAKGDTAAVPAAVASPTAVETPVRIAPPQAPAAAHPTEKRAEVAAAPTPRPAAPPPPALPQGGSFQIQVNAMADKSRADELVHDLRSLGYTALISSARINGKTLYRVRVGALGSAEAAKQAVTRLREQGYPNAFLVAE